MITNHQTFAPSEFDKALMTGVASRGHASSFFSSDSIKESDCATTNNSCQYSKNNNKIKNKSRNKLRNKNNKIDSQHPLSSKSEDSDQPESASLSNNPNRSSGTGSNMEGKVSASSTVAASKSVMTTLRPHPDKHGDNLSLGVLPDALMTMRQKIESLTLFNSDMIKMASETMFSLT